MLANQVRLPEVQPSVEPSKAPEIKRSRDDTRSSEFDRLMQDSRREQLDERRPEKVSERQTTGNEAKPAVEQKATNRDSNDKQDYQQDDAATLQSASDDSAQSEHDCEHDEAKGQTQTELKPVVQVSGTDVEAEAEKLSQLGQDETSKWLDTILSIGNDVAESGDVTAAQLAEFDALLQQGVSVDVEQVQQVLEKMDIDIDLSEFTSASQIPLSQLKSLLSDGDLERVAQQLNQLASSLDQDFEALMAQISGDKGTDVDKLQFTPVEELQTELQQRVNAQLSEAQTVATVAPQVIKEESTNNKVDAMIELEKLQGQIPNNKQSSLAIQQQQEKLQSVMSELLTPSTKVVDISGNIGADGKPMAPNAQTTDMLKALSSAADQSELQRQLDSSFANAAQDGKVAEGEEGKLGALLGSLATEEVKTSDLASKADKVNVAGVTLDKTLQMPKVENLTQARQEVVVRENILFNKQELAAQMQTQVGMMLARNMKSVDIRLDPPELGSMQVKLSVQNDQAAVSFVVSNQQAKDALENSLPKLKELLEQQGMQLADSDVQQQSSQSGQSQADEGQDVKGQSAQAGADSEQSELEQQEQMINRAINSPWNVSYYA